jgi:hypothetical protein
MKYSPDVTRIRADGLFQAGFGLFSATRTELAIPENWTQSCVRFSSRKLKANSPSIYWPEKLTAKSQSVSEIGAEA